MGLPRAGHQRAVPHRARGGAVQPRRVAGGGALRPRARARTQFWWQARLRAFSLAERALSDLGAAAHRSDDLFFLVSAARLVRCVASFLFAANRQFEPSDRMLAIAIAELPILPDGFLGKLDNFMRPIAAHQQGGPTRDRPAHGPQPHAARRRGEGLRGRAPLFLLPAVLALVLAGCTARFQSFPFVTADGERIEIRQSPGKSRDQEAVFAPMAARLRSPVYSLRKPFRVTASRQAFAFSYTSTLPDSRLSILSDRKTVMRSVELPPSGGTTLRFLVPLSTGDQIWGYQLSARSPASPGESLHLKAAGTGPFVHGFAISPEGLSVDGSVEVLSAGPDGVSARITQETRNEMEQGIWRISLDIAHPAELPGRNETIRFGGEGQQAVCSVDSAAAPPSISFVRGSMDFLPRNIQTRLPVEKLDISFVPVDKPIPADPGMILSWDRSAWRTAGLRVVLVGKVSRRS